MKSVQALVVLALVMQGTRACPEPCVCKWKNGKQAVECIEENLTGLPNGIDPETQVLDFSGNNVKVVQRERFVKLGIINLQKIYLAGCRLHKIENQAFKGLANLVELDLSENYLSIIPSSNFLHVPSLMRLILSNNPLTLIKAQAFQPLTYLNTLEVSNCQVEFIEDEAFNGLNHLEWLKIDGNRLANIQGNKIFPETLHGIDLHNNNWHCDCQLRDLSYWLINYNIPQSVEPTCHEPKRLKGRALYTLTEIDLACLPDVSPTMLYLEINEGKNISLQCQVTAIPEAKISWWFQGQILQNDSIIAPGFHLYYYVEEGTVDKKSELFIYNTNTEDNGTFSCIAENPAGRAQSNYTIRIIVKEEPIVIVVTFPFEYIIVLVCGGAFVLGTIILAIIMTTLKCKKNSKRRKKKESSKDVALQNACAPVKHSSLEPIIDSFPPKMNGSLIIKTQVHHQVMHYPAGREMSKNSGSDSMYHHTFIENYGQGDTNPDLVHDAQTVEKNRESITINGSALDTSYRVFGDYNEKKLLSMHPPRQVKWQDQQNVSGGIATLPRGIIRDHAQLSADVHLNPGYFMDNEGYPADFGLPKLPLRQTQSVVPNSSNYYQTLPHNRNKFKKSVCQLPSYCQDNEFQSGMNEVHDTFVAGGVRYTVDGYPFAKHRADTSVGYGGDQSGFVPSPPEGYKSEESEPVATRCVPTQTEGERRAPALDKERDGCSESPDEGYGGDGAD